ncbi:MAG TPA: PKD domain-containing protein [Solirubrobacterales bacterium]|nr:PKD domain-containing protein [Solirubrobacterales bacterium]
MPPLGFLVAAVLVAALASPATAREIYVANAGDGTVSAIESKANAVVATIPVGGEPVDVAIAPDGGRAYVADAAGDAVLAIDTGTHQVVGPPIEVGEGPSGIAISPDGTRAYVANSEDDTVSVLDLATGSAVATIPLEAGAEPASVAISPDGATAFVAQRGDDIALIATAANVVTGAVQTGAGLGPARISLEPDGARGFVTNSNSTSVSVFNTITATVLGAPLPVGTNPAGIAVNPNGPRTYVAAKSADTVVAIDTSSHQTVGSPIGGFASPSGIAIAPDGTRAYVTNGTAASVTILDTLANLPAGQVAVGAEPQGIAIVPDQGPTASFAVASAKRDAGAPVVFDASVSSDRDGQVALYAWSFGDGESEVTQGPTAEHVYAKPGPYTVSLTVTDAEGCSVARLFTGQTVACNGSPRGSARQRVEIRDATPPDFRLSGARRQRLSRRVVVVGRCPVERCQMSARGFSTSLLRGPKRTLRKRGKTRPARVELANGVERRLRLRLPGAAYRAARRALANGGRASVKVKAAGSDAAGNARRRSLRIALFLPAPKKKKKGSR